MLRYNINGVWPAAHVPNPESDVNCIICIRVLFDRLTDCQRLHSMDHDVIWHVLGTIEFPNVPTSGNS